MPSAPRPAGYWLREAMAAQAFEPLPPLVGETDADVVVVGGGYTGMWSAYFLTEQDPGVRVLLLEQQVCGGGPSGRNGGFATGWWDEIHDLVELFGEGPALAACRALGRSIRGIGEWCDRHGVDAWYRRAGYLNVAASPAQEGSWSGAVDAARRLGAGEEYIELGAAQVRSRCSSPVFGGGAFMRDGATVQPARLALGLRHVLLERGIRIHEGSPALRFCSGPPVEVETPSGRVRAGRAILAPGAWAAGWPRMGRSLALWGSHIVLTAPAPERLEEIGWTGGECITDARSALHYFRTTPDGRIAFGGGGGRAGWGGSVGARYWSDPESVGRTQRGLRRLFPSFAGVPVEEAWGGPIDVSGSHLPFFGTLPGGRVHYGFGYTGNGVGPAHLAGRILSALAVDRDEDVTRLPLVDGRPRRFPPEPLRSLGAHVVREATVRVDRAHDDGRRPKALLLELARLPRRLGYRLGPE